MSAGEIATASYANWRAGYDEGRRTERAEAAPVPLSARIPSHWLANAAIAEAVALLDQHPDLQDDEDIALALGSEAPDAITFLDAFVAAIATQEDAMAAARQRAKSLYERANRIEERAHALRERLADMLDRLGMRRHVSAYGTVIPRNTLPRLHVTDNLDELPAEFVRVRTVREADRAAISAALKSGATVPGATLGNVRRSILLRVTA